MVSYTSTTFKGSSSSLASKSLFIQSKQIATDKLIAVGDRVLFDYDSAKLDSSSLILLDAQPSFF